VQEEMPRSGPFREAGCVSILYEIKALSDKFDIPRFREAMKLDKNAQSPGFVTCRARDVDRLDYHIHFSWKFESEPEGLTLSVSYHRDIKKVEEQEEPEPYVEQFMTWLGQFFSDPSTHAEAGAQFRYSAKTRKTRYLLPVRVNMPGPEEEAEIEGIFVSFPSRPSGVSRATLIQTKNIYVELFGEAEIKFSDFDVSTELAKLSAFAQSLTETRNA